ncbi:MAG: 3-oxoacyl-ACP reductase FabG [Thermaerobacter sp.]|nr:3-oxoacyl-ACP reductase FabG [Thermaerobacter sp.]
MRTIQSLWDLTGRTALVTGGGRGLGEAMAWALAEAGAQVAVVSRNDSACQLVADAIRRGTGRPTFACPLDLSRADGIPGAVKQVQDALGPIDIVVNNAGISWGASFESMPREQWDRVMTVNVTGAFLVTQAVIGGMRDRGWGRVINVASIAGMRGIDPLSMEATGYHASKGALIAMTRDLAVKYGPYQITVNAVAPGFIPTKMTRGLLAKSVDRILARVPLGRLGDPSDLKGVTVLLASDAGAYINGQVIAVDGGTTAQ